MDENKNDSVLHTHILTPDNWIDGLQQQVHDLHRQSLHRERFSMQRTAPGLILLDGKEYVDFSSNDYLGLAADPSLREVATAAATQCGFAASASPLVTGFHPVHQQLEATLAEFEQSPSTILFPSGFAANIGTIPTLVGPGDVIFSDRRNHASLIDGCRLSRAEIQIYDTDDLDGLRRRIAQSTSNQKRMIVTDSVFSMDGDIAPLDRLAEIAEESHSLLYVDEAHATGVLGQHGRGAAEQMAVHDRIHIRMGTLSKALASVGGFISAEKLVTDWIVNRARSYVYSTALPPAAAAVAIQAVKIATKASDRRTRLQHLARSLRTTLREMGFDYGRSHETPIVPIIVGEPDRSIDLAQHLKMAGLLAVPIRPPTVPIGTSRVRISLSAAHDDDVLNRLTDALQDWKGR